MSLRSIRGKKARPYNKHKISLRATVPRRAEPGWRNAAFCAMDGTTAESGIVARRLAPT
ncbi:MULTISPECIES: hypothetical protein [Dehalobacter]|uniref:hypothetical protein n=1 Tax=Dehalobacter TaxID=56112 RepID=UPI00130E145C|nr:MULTISPECIES: hypothetical protein [Dehalobacter]MCG1026426.1 hypothetical protein [Dehalobacter sp.]